MILRMNNSDAGKKTVYNKFYVSGKPTNPHFLNMFEQALFISKRVHYKTLVKKVRKIKSAFHPTIILTKP